MSHPITKTSVCSSESSLHQSISLDEEIPEINFISESESYQNDDLIKVMLENFKKVRDYLFHIYCYRKFQRRYG